MPLNVTPSLRVNPQSLPAGGGTVRVTFAANTFGGQSRLRADYSLGSGVPYRLAGSAQLPTTAVFADPRDFSMNLTLQPTGNTGGVSNVRIIAEVHEVLAGGQDGESSQSVGRVAIQQTAAETTFAETAAAPPSPGAGGGLGERLKAFRDKRGMTQKEAADRSGVGRSTISRLENGGEPSEATRERLEALLRSK